MTQDIIGSRKGDYEILALLGVGGMGQVYKVRNVLSDRVEAMKVLLPNLADQKGLADRFIREIKVLAGIHHPNIAELRTALTIDNQLVMIMEFVDGVTLSTRVQQGAIPYGQALGYIQQVLAALSYAHSQKIIHRDIKPANMMLTPTGVVKLMDFGIARQDGDVGLTVTNSTVGSIAYMSPEQVKGEPADARSDLYSVGVSLYEMVTGQRPFQGDTGFAIMQAHLQTMPKPPIEVRPDLPATLSDLIMMAVAKEPAKRFQSADAFSRAIGSVMPIIEGTAPMATASRSPAPSFTPTRTPSPAAIVVSPSATGATMVSTSPSSGSAFQATQFASAPSAITSTPAPRPAAAASTARPPVAQTMPRPPQNSYRGFYIALGALIVLVVLAAAGFYVPRHLKTMAAQQSSSSASDSSAARSSTPDASSTASPAAASRSDSSTATPASASTLAPAASVSTAASAPASASDSSAPHVKIPPRATTAASSATASDASAPHISIPPRAGASSSSAAAADTSAAHISIPPRAGTAQQAAGSTAPSGSMAASSDSTSPSSPAAEKPSSDAAALQQAETETDQLSSRGAAVTTSLDGLKKGQAAQGLGLRGDMAAAEQRMQNNLAKAQSAVAAGDAAQAQHYLSLAEPDVEKLEKFLGH